MNGIDFKMCKQFKDNIQKTGNEYTKQQVNQNKWRCLMNKSVTSSVKGLMFQV